MDWLKPATGVAVILVIFGALGATLVFTRLLIGRPEALAALSLLAIALLLAIAYGARAKAPHTTTYW